jgi:phosphate starvation-inducible protein PhoH and related proteins
MHSAQPIALHDHIPGLTKRERKAQRRQLAKKPNRGLSLRQIEPLTPAQEEAFEEFDSGQHLLLHGVAGTGKTYISLFLALQETLQNQFEKTVIVRSVVPTRDMGFLPGNLKEKARAYELPYYGIATDLFGRGDAYEILKTSQQVEFLSTSYLRGTTIRNACVVIDEAQNLTFHELDSVITRLGDGCRVIVCGDFRQSDLTLHNDRTGIKSFMNIIRDIKGFSNVEFGAQDIVRSGLVKEYIISKINHGIV